MSGVVYHFSDTVHLAWIVARGELQPSIIKHTPLGFNTHLWATINPEGDRTALPLREIHGGDGGRDWRDGKFWLLRFTLPADRFLSLNETQQFENWDLPDVDKLLDFDRREYDVVGEYTWRLRRDPLQLRDVIKIEATSYDSHETERWWPLDLADLKVLRTSDPDRLGIRVGRRKRFYSERIKDDDYHPGAVRYVPWVAPTAEQIKEYIQDLEIIARMEQEESDFDAEYDEDDAEYDEANE